VRTEYKDDSMAMKKNMLKVVMLPVFRNIPGESMYGTAVNSLSTILLGGLSMHSSLHISKVI
jgi:hypothetical protein